MKKGFTLAEVLITLGIIGVVAALTMPTLISQHNKTVVVTRMQKFYSAFNQAILMAENENGLVEDWIQEFSTDDYGEKESQVEFFEKYLKKHIKYLKYETGFDPQYPLGGVKVYLNDGSAFLMGHRHLIFYPVANKDKIDGKDRFGFLWNEETKVLVPYGYLITDRDDLINASDFGCGRAANENRRYCSALIIQDGWKISDDYPVRF